MSRADSCEVTILERSPGHPTVRRCEINLDADDLLARMRRDFPVEYELVLLRTTVDVLTAENEHLKAQQGSYDPSTVRPFLEPEGSRHG